MGFQYNHSMKTGDPLAARAALCGDELPDETILLGSNVAVRSGQRFSSAVRQYLRPGINSHLLHINLRCVRCVCHVRPSFLLSARQWTAGALLVRHPSGRRSGV